ncbi:hypothetical protein GCM10028809_58130 [Spirosoma gilvum]
MAHSGLTQPRLTPVHKPDIPSSARYTGQLKQAVRWTDNTGDQLVILTETGPQQSTKGQDDYREAALYAYHYALDASGSRLTWKVYDFVTECPVDIELYFVAKTFAVTDLNKDGKAEVWLMYKSGCHGDVSPISMKIIMYENGKKYAVRGETRVKVSATEYMGGSYSFDAAFKSAPSLFRQYASTLWQQHQQETYTN